MAQTKKWVIRWPGRWLYGLPMAAMSVMAAWLASGCDSASFAPPPPDDLQSAEGSAPPKFFTPPPSSDILSPPRAGARAVALVLARHDLDEGEILLSSARAQAGYDKVKLDIAKLGSQDLPAQQASLVQEVLARNPLALILEPADTADKHLAQSVSEAQAAGVPVLFLNRPLSTQTSKPATLVGAPSFSASAQQLVESAIRNAKNGGLDPKRGAILVINTVSDAFADDRVSAIHQALQKAGVNSIEEFRFAYKADTANNLVADRLKANTKAVLVFAIDSQCLPPIRQFTTQPEFVDRPFVVAGYVSDDRLIPFTLNGDFAAVAEFNSNRLVRKAITAAASSAQGKELPGRIEVPVEFHDSPPGSGRAKRNPSDMSDKPKRREKPGN
jgi:ABC-type sugar transport system substrate-binding protein